MSYLALYAGLLLPWVTGTIGLIAIERRLPAAIPPNLLRQSGYGFFLGYAVLFLLIKGSQSLTGGVSWAALMAVLLLMVGVFALLIKSGPAPRVRPAPNATENLRQSKPVFWLTMLLLAWITVHLLTYAIDIYTQPVFPWDAWLAWIYRAKAWFLGGDISAVVSTADWLKNSADGIYTIDAWQYPTFPSVTPYWAAVSLGIWSETLINVPVLLAAIAIGMALYGQCREYGLNVMPSVLSCYLLYSIPLFGTHIALAGYADIWMAGFTGLGLMALVRSLLQRACQPAQPFGTQMALAFVLLTLAVAVKNEGAVWLLAAIGMLVILSFRARVPVLIVVGAGLLILIGFAFGITHLNLPILGSIGFTDGRLVIPFIGKFALEPHNIWHGYITNFFAMGSWNLFWVLVLATAALAVRNNDDIDAKRIQVIGLTFFCIFFATQFFIFGLTDQGLWADTFTAINRLPLHFVPALLFTVFVVLDTCSTKRPNSG